MIELVHHGRPGRERPLLAIPGLDGSEGSILPLVERLSRRRQVIVLNYAAEDNPTLEALTFEIASTVRRRMTGPFDLLGQSIGSIMAAQLAGLGALDVEKLVLSCTFTRVRSNVLRVSNSGLRVMPPFLYRVLAAPMMAVVCGPVGDGKRHPFLSASQASDPRDVRRRTAWQIRRDFTPDLRHVQCSTLILMGEKDRFVPSVRKEIVRLERAFEGRDHKLVVIPDAGHVLLPSQAIDSAYQEIEGFLS